MRSRRGTHAILSLPHKYRVPLRRKRSLGYARDDDTRERAISHSLSFLHVEGCPCGADLSSAFGAPLLQGAAPLACKSAAPKRHSLPEGGSQRNESTAFPVPKAFPSRGRLRYENTAFPRIVISSEARNLPCTTVKRRALDEEQHLAVFLFPS